MKQAKLTAIHNGPEEEVCRDSHAPVQFGSDNIQCLAYPLLGVHAINLQVHITLLESSPFLHYRFINMKAAHDRECSACTGPACCCETALQVENSKINSMQGKSMLELVRAWKNGIN